MKGLGKRILTVCLSLTMLVGVSALPVSMSVDAANLYNLSNDYKKNGSTEAKFYKQLKNTVNSINNKVKTQSVSYMSAAASIAESQLWYSCYATFGNLSAVRWNGLSARKNEYNTGNTEYTRWFFTNVVNEYDSRFYDLDWCAIFASWCMYHAGYHASNSDKYVVYSSCADPRKDLATNERHTSFNGAPSKCWYTCIGTVALNENSYVEHDWSGYYGYKDFKTWNKAVKADHRNRSALYKYTKNGKIVNGNGIPYKRGGLIFFDWDQDGHFDHVGIVRSVSGDTLTYMEGNSCGSNNGTCCVRSTSINLVTKGASIAAYMEY